MIGISTTTSNASGAIIIHEDKDSELEKYPARVTRSATLDGGAEITHLGFSHGDRTLIIKCAISESDAIILTEIHQTETLINISMKDDFFSGVISKMDIDGGNLDMEILIEEKLSA